jgi:hypothetical protein
MRQWYYLVGDEQAGPVSFEELRHLGSQGRVTPRTLVWKEGLEDWTPAGEVSGIFAAAPPPPGQTASAPLAPLAPAAPAHVDTHLAKAILATIFCCMPLGVVAIVKAVMVQGRLDAGDVEGARRLSREASTWGNWSIGLALVGMAVYFVFVALIAVFGD